MGAKEKLLYLLAALCLLLGAAMQFVFTAVRFTGFLFWCAAAVLVLLALLDRWRKKHRWALWVRRGVLAALAAGFAQEETEKPGTVDKGLLALQKKRRRDKAGGLSGRGGGLSGAGAPGGAAAAGGAGA